MEKLDSRSRPPVGVTTTNWDRMVYSFTNRKTRGSSKKYKPRASAVTVIVSEGKKAG